MRYSVVLVGIGLWGLVVTATGGSCKKGLSEEDIRRIVRDEVQEQLRERKRRQAARGPGSGSGPGSGPGSPAAGDPARRGPTGAPMAGADTSAGRVERLRRRVQTLEKLVERFAKTPGISKERLRMMKEQLRAMRERLARAEGKASGGTASQPSSQPSSQSPSSAAPAKSGALSRADWRDALSAGIRPLGKLRWEVDRRILTSVLRAPTLARGDASFRPYKLGGKVRGIQLASVRAKGLFALLGLKKGDVIARINHHALTSSDQALGVIKGLSKARLMTATLLRSGARMVFVYTVK